MEVIGGRGQRWQDVQRAWSSRTRLFGLTGRRPHRPLLLRTALVHGFWLRKPIWIVGIHRSGEVVGVRMLGRRRMVWMRGAHWILELPIALPTPRPGDRLTWRPGDGEPGGDAGTSLSLRHPDRQPG